MIAEHIISGFKEMEKAIYTISVYKSEEQLKKHRYVGIIFVV